MKRGASEPSPSFRSPSLWVLEAVAVEVAETVEAAEEEAQQRGHSELGAGGVGRLALALPWVRSDVCIAQG